MKKLLFLLLLIPSVTIAQVYETTEDIYFEKVIYIEGKTKDALFLAAKEWLAEAFMETKDIIRFEDRENGKIVSYGNEAIHIKLENLVKILGTIAKKNINTNNRLLFVLKTYFKDGRSKITLTKTRVALVKGPVIEKEAPLSKFYFNKKGKPRTKMKGLKKEVVSIFNKVALEYEQALKKNSTIGDW